MYNIFVNIVIIGHICIDKNTTENASYTAAGGPAVFMQKIFSHIPHVSTTIVTPYGNDFLHIAPQLPLFPTHPTNNITLVYENTMIKKIRHQKAYNREEASPILLDKNFIELLQKADILFFTPLLPNLSPAYIKSVTMHAKNDAVKVLLPQGYYRDFTSDNEVIVREFREAPEILPLMDIVIVSEQDSQNMHEKASGWTKEYNLLSVVTVGENGAVAIQNGAEISLPTQAVPNEEVVDSIGSGDIFSASFAYAYKVTHSLEKSGSFANAVAKSCLFYTSDHITVYPSLLKIL